MKGLLEERQLKIRQFETYMYSRGNRVILSIQKQEVSFPILIKSFNTINTDSCYEMYIFAFVIIEEIKNSYFLQIISDLLYKGRYKRDPFDRNFIPEISSAELMLNIPISCYIDRIEKKVVQEPYFLDISSKGRINDDIFLGLRITENMVDQCFVDKQNKRTISFSLFDLIDIQD